LFEEETKGGTLAARRGVVDDVVIASAMIMFLLRLSYSVILVVSIVVVSIAV
jgi:hypothetical protein